MTSRRIAKKIQFLIPTEIQASILQYIQDRQRANKRITLAQIAKRFGFITSGGARYHVVELAKKGYLRWEPGKAATYQVKDKISLLVVPEKPIMGRGWFVLVEGVASLVASHGCQCVISLAVAANSTPFEP